MIKVKFQYENFSNTVLIKFFKTKEQVDVFKSQHPDYKFIWFMNLPITEDELKKIISILEKSGEEYKSLYAKLWSFNVNRKK